MEQNFRLSLCVAFVVKAVPQVSHFNSTEYPFLALDVFKICSDYSRGRGVTLTRGITSAGSPAPPLPSRARIWSQILPHAPQTADFATVLLPMQGNFAPLGAWRRFEIHLLTRTNNAFRHCFPTHNSNLAKRRFLCRPLYARAARRDFLSERSAHLASARHVVWRAGRHTRGDLP